MRVSWHTYWYCKNVAPRGEIKAVVLVATVVQSCRAGAFCETAVKAGVTACPEATPVLACRPPTSPDLHHSDTAHNVTASCRA